MTHIHWPRGVDATVTHLGQDLTIAVNEVVGDPIGTLRIKAAAFVGSGVALPNSTKTTVTWTAIPGTNPVLEVRQDGYFRADYIEVRRADGSIGAGVPPGGSTGQVLAKATAANYDTTWVNQSGGGGGGTTSGYVWNGSAYVLDSDQRLFVGPSAPPTPQEGDVWFNTATGSATVQGFNLATSLPATVTAGGVAHNKGPWTELVTSTVAPMAEIVLLVQQATGLSGAGLRGTLADVGIGAAGSEAVMVANLDIGRTSAAQSYRLPLFVPAGSRIAVRTQSFTASLAVNVQLAASSAPTFATYFGGAWRYAGAGSTATTWGVTAANSLPQALTLPGVVNDFGAWIQFEASTSAQLRYLLLLPSGPNVAGWSTAPAALFDVGVGGAGSEQSVLDSGMLAFTWNTTEVVARCPLLVGVDIPAGSRLSARYRASDITQAASASLVGFS